MIIWHLLELICLCRDWLVGNATAQSSIIPTSTLTNASSYSGNISFGGYTYFTSVSYVSGLLPNTSDGINHYLTVGENNTNAVDGLVAVLNVKIVGRPAGSYVYCSHRVRCSRTDTSTRSFTVAAKQQCQDHGTYSPWWPFSTSPLHHYRTSYPCLCAYSPNKEFPITSLHEIPYFLTSFSSSHSHLSFDATRFC